MSANQNNSEEAPPTVQFASRVDTQEIDPKAPVARNAATDSPDERQVTGQTKLQFNQLQEALGETRLQSRRASAYHFEPISLPASRVSETQNPSPASSVHNGAAQSYQYEKFTASLALALKLEVRVL